MSTIQSSAEHLTLNADGTSKDIKLQSNASEKVIIKSDGNVGLGTSSPDSSLEIYKASTAELMIGSDNGGTAQISLYENDSTTKEATIKYDGFANNLVIGTSGEANAIVIPRDSGNVGIGTSSISSYHSGADDLVVYASGSSGITIATGDTTSTVALKFADGTDVTSENAGYIDYAHSDNSMRFGTTATERMRIDSSGNVLIGKTTAGSAEGCQLEPVGTAFLVRSNGPAAICGRNDSTGEVIRIVDSGTTVGTISVNGSATAYNTTSDYRLKENVDYTWDATTRLKQLKPARFNFIADDTNTLVDGFIAHEVSSVVPEAISGEKDAMMDEEYEVTPAVEEVRDEEGNITTEAVEAVMGTRSVPDYQGIDQSKLVPLLVKTIQELEARITALEA